MAVFMQLASDYNKNQPLGHKSAVVKLKKFSSLNVLTKHDYFVKMLPHRVCAQIHVYVQLRTHPMCEEIKIYQTQ